MKKGNYILGLHINPTAVGWSLIDKSNNLLVDMGVRSFLKAGGNQEVKHRGNLGPRRYISAPERVTRIAQLLKILTLAKANFVPANKEIYLLRQKGLTQKIKKEELAISLLHIAKRSEIDITYNKISAAFLKDEYICQYQLAHYDYQTGRFAGDKFHRKDFFKEFSHLLRQQQQYYPELEPEVVLELEAVFNLPIKYNKNYLYENGELADFDLLNLVKPQCRFFPNNDVVAAKSLAALKYQLVLDLTNIQYQGKKLNKKQINYFIDNYLYRGKNITKRDLANYLNVPTDLIDDYSIIKCGNKRISGLKVLLSLAKKSNEEQKILANLTLVEQIITILTFNEDVKIRLILLEKLVKEYYSDNLKQLIAMDKIISGFHYLSSKAIDEILFLIVNENYSLTAAFKKIINNNLLSKKDDSDIASAAVDFEIIDPIAKRAQRESIKIINAIKNKYQAFPDLVFSIANELKEKIDSANMEIYLKNHPNLTKNNYLLPENQLMHLLHYQQNGRCLYCNCKIDLADITQTKLYQIDHIIPISYHFDYSINNKLLVCTKHILEKNNQTPYQYLQANNTLLSFGQFKKLVLSTNKLPPEKITNLLSKKVYNIVPDDFRYQTKAFTNIIRDYAFINNLALDVCAYHPQLINYYQDKSNWKGKNKTIDHVAIKALLAIVVNKIKNNQNIDLSDLSVQKMTIKYSYKINNYSTIPLDSGNNRVVNSCNIFEHKNPKMKQIMEMFKHEQLAKSLLIYHQDKKLYNLLKQIASTYQYSTEAFAHYSKAFGPIKICENGPAIYTIRYQYFTESINLPHRYDIYYDKEKRRYMVVVINYQDCQEIKSFNQEKHIELKYIPHETILSGQVKLQNKKPVLSLYKNSVFECIYKNKKSIYFLEKADDKMLYVNRLNQSNKKPLALNLLSISQIRKVYLDVLGNYFYRNEESKKNVQNLAFIN